MRKIEPRYKLGNVEVFGRGYPQYHFENSDVRGFDIASGVEAFSQQPPESGGYKVWGNSLGCFDSESIFDGRPEVYLAGDSFTWGYAPFGYKFGTLIESHLSISILKCGVTHTGQRHQFSKFKEITRKIGVFPKIVIFNVVANDIANDFAFPHSKIVDGFQYEDTFLEKRDSKFVVVRKDIEDLESDHRTALKASKTKKRQIKNYLKNYSATAVLLAAVKQKILSYYNYEVSGTRHYSVYGLYPLSDSYPIDRYFSKANRNVLIEWNDHSIAKDYRLLVSLVPLKDLYGIDYYRDFKKFLENAKIDYVDFEDYVAKNNIEHDTLYWNDDDHFNIEGNRLYAVHLEKVLQKIFGLNQ